MCNALWTTRKPSCPEQITCMLVELCSAGSKALAWSAACGAACKKSGCPGVDWELGPGLDPPRHQTVGAKTCAWFSDVPVAQERLVGVTKAACRPVPHFAAVTVRAGAAPGSVLRVHGREPWCLQGSAVQLRERRRTRPCTTACPSLCSTQVLQQARPAQQALV